MTIIRHITAFSQNYLSLERKILQYVSYFIFHTWVLLYIRLLMELKQFYYQKTCQCHLNFIHNYYKAKVLKFLKKINLFFRKNHTKTQFKNNVCIKFSTLKVSMLEECSTLLAFLFVNSISFYTADQATSSYLFKI